MLKRELKVNFKNFIIWLSIIVGLFLVIFLIYPSIINGDNIKDLDNLMKIFPEKVLKAFNLDISSISTAFGWFKTEGFVFILLLTGCYSGILGSNILLKEESDKTIEYLNSLPITRTKIVITKVVSGLIYIFALILLLAIFNGISLELSGELDYKQFILLSITPLFSSVVIYFLCLFLSTFTHKTKKMLGITLGIVFISYICYMFSSISEETEFLKYISIFTLSDTRNVIENISINPLFVGLSFLISIVLFSLITIRYNKKELV